MKGVKEQHQGRYAEFCSYIKEERVTHTNCPTNNGLSSKGLVVVDSQYSFQSLEGSNSGRVFQLDSLVVKLGFFNLILQKQLLCIFLLNQIKFFKI